MLLNLQCGINEANNIYGANRCVSSSECDGARNCSKYGYCEGNSGCSTNVSVRKP